MNFFEYQASARRRTLLYVSLFALATLVIVAAANLVALGVVWVFMSDGLEHLYDGHWWSVNPRAMMWTTLGTLAVVGAASIYRIVTLAGGGAVARDLGGTLVDTSTHDPRQRQLVNVVEEIAIAAGVPVPQVYVLERETGINAFAAGFTTSDAAIAVTRGALTYLTRDELQGVIGHEFSHILNGDTRLNTRLIGVLFGILVIGLAGRKILEGAARDARALFYGLLPGLALMVIGYLGYFFGQMIQAAVSRSREVLADASAVQFTRNPPGLAGALKKIALLHGTIGAARAGEVSHMCIADAGGFGAFFATHPPILERIRAIEPYFRASDLKRLHLAAAPEPAPAIAPAAGGSIEQIALSPAGVAAAVGQLGDGALAVAAGLHAAIPAPLLHAAHRPDEAVLLMLALMLGPKPEARAADIEAIRPRLALPADEAARVDKFAREVARLDPVYRLPLSEIAFPALRQRTPEQLRALAAALEQLAQGDGEVSVFEYALARLVRLQLYELMAPRARRAGMVSPKLYRLRAEAQALLSVLARVGHADERAARLAYAQGMRRLFAAQAPEYAPSCDWRALDQALVRLDMLAPAIKQELIEALVLTVSHDQQLTLTEAELLRTLCASLHCPLPPLPFSSRAQ